jgi:hypothetical protein
MTQKQAGAIVLGVIAAASAMIVVDKVVTGPEIIIAGAAIVIIGLVVGYWLFHQE